MSYYFASRNYRQIAQEEMDLPLMEIVVVLTKKPVRFSPVDCTLYTINLVDFFEMNAQEEG